MSEEIAGLLREIRDQQRIQVDRQAEALALQRRAGKAVKTVLWVVLPLLLFVLATLLWPWLRYLMYRYA